MTENTKENAPDEGTRSFTRTIDQLNFGETQIEMSEELHDLTIRMLAHARKHACEVKGRMTVTLDLTCDGHGQLMIQASSKSGVAKPKGGTSHAWLTPGGNVTFKNPRQQELPLHEVNNEPGDILDIEAGEQGESNGT
jgi:hypothetical protein